MSSPGALCSDHVNYLILRYLQEAGHKTAAEAFYTDWRRLPEFHDPENYPFAPIVQRGELVSVIQDGLHHDALIARIKKNERKFHFTNATSREAQERRERVSIGGQVENGSTSRPSSSGVKRKGRPPAMRQPEDFPTPPPKRQRRSEGSEGAHLNGDAMDVDAASASPDAEDDGDAVSPAVASETEVVEPERYDSMDVAVQTDVKNGPKTSTIYWKIDRPGATIYHSIFNPDPDPKHVRTLLTVGESLCRFSQTPETIEDARQVMSIDEPTLPPGSVVTASAWHPSGHTAVCAIDSIREVNGGGQKAYQDIICHNRDQGTYRNFLIPPLLEPDGIILLLRYNSTGDHLLVLQTNLTRSVVLIYDTSTETTTTHEPIAWCISEHQMLDAAWCGELTFTVCGERCLAQTYTIDKAFRVPEEGFSAETIPQVGLTAVETSITGEPTTIWDKVAYDASSHTFALASTLHHRLVLGRFDQSSSTPAVRFEHHTPTPSRLTAFAFQPFPTSSTAPSQPLLATTFQDGTCSIYTRPQSSPTDLQPLLTLHLADGPALALAWSHDGEYLAISGTDLVQIWLCRDLVQCEPTTQSLTERRESTREPLVTWRPDVNATRVKNGDETNGVGPLREPSLSWTADGGMLGFAIERQIAVISFRPPLEGKGVEVGEVEAVKMVNGNGVS